jgi:hypothetical protein
MKNKVLALLILLPFASHVKAQDKAFQKGNMVIDLGVGLGVYGTKVHQEYDQDVYVFPTGIKTERVKKDTTDAAASFIFPLRFEYGITNWLGVGARLAYSKYATEKDSVNNYKPKVYGVDADLVISFHLVKSKHFDMPVCLSLGYSSITYKANNPNTNPPFLPDNGNGMAKGGGSNYGISLVPRIYFGDHVGMFFNVGYAGYNYPHLIFSNNSDSNLNDDNNMIYKLKGNGLNLGLGIVGKF